MRRHFTTGLSFLITALILSIGSVLVMLLYSHIKTDLSVTTSQLSSASTPTPVILQPWGVTPIPPEITPKPIPTVPPPQPAVPPPTPKPSDPYRFRAYAARVPDVRISTNEAMIIATGTVKQVLPARWSTDDGMRPGNPHAPNNKETIYTPVLLHVEQYLKGQQPQPELLFFAFGGIVGQDSATASDNLYEFQTGEHIIVFLARGSWFAGKQTLNGRPFWRVVGHYTIENGQVFEVTQRDRRMPLQQVLDEIQTAMKQ